MSDKHGMRLPLKVNITQGSKKFSAVPCEYNTITGEITSLMLKDKKGLEPGGCVVEFLDHGGRPASKMSTRVGVALSGHGYAIIIGTNLNQYLKHQKNQKNARASRDARVYQLIEDDCNEVWEEIRHIQACRSNIYIATIGSSVATIGTFVTISYTVPGVNRLVLYAIGATLSAFFLTLGLLSVVEKAKAINLRKGFLMTLTEMRRTGKIPHEYRGWADLQTARADCIKHRNMKQCGQIDESSGQHEDGRQHTTCWTVGEGEFTPYKKHVRLLPALTESFMSLSGYVYMVLLSGSLVTIMACTSKLTADLWVSIKWYSIYSVPFLSFAIGMTIPVYTFAMSQRKNRKRSTSEDHRVNQIVRLALAIVAVALSLVLAYVLNDYWRTHPEIFAGSGISKLTALSTLPLSYISAAYILFKGLAHLEACRYGAHSKVAYHFAWKHVLNDCHPLRHKDSPVRITCKNETIDGGDAG